MASGSENSEEEKIPVLAMQDRKSFDQSQRPGTDPRKTKSLHKDYGSLKDCNKTNGRITETV